MIRLDTHVVLWLYTGDTDRLGPAVNAALDADDDLAISPIVELELTYLHEIGRLNVSGAQVTADLRARLGLALSDLSMASVVAAAAALTWTRDPFDRLIVGDALAANGVLVTKDESILEHVHLARW
ncbi:MAG: type II toxin-antitoxin system VapC family toxin [Ilumatobacteraceae bacterium]